MTRRSALLMSSSLAFAPLAKPSPAAPAGRLKQSAARWCYAKIPMDDLCRQAAELGLSGLDLVDEKDWPTCAKYGLVPAIVSGAGNIPVAWNRKENHEKLENDMRVNVAKAAAAKAAQRHHVLRQPPRPRRRRRPRQLHPGTQARRKIGEDAGITICLELLNSKVDHKDYQCDHTKWGVEVVKAVGSPRVKLLYDIYHMQIMEGDVIRTIRENIQYIGHFHTGGVPGRHEFDETQELNWRTIAQAIADLKFEGYIAHEFVPVKDPMASLKQAITLCTV